MVLEYLKNLFIRSPTASAATTPNSSSSTSIASVSNSAPSSLYTVSPYTFPSVSSSDHRVESSKTLTGYFDLPLSPTSNNPAVGTTRSKGWNHLKTRSLSFA